MTPGPKPRTRGPANAEANLERLGIDLPEVPSPVGNFELGSIDGTTLYLSGQGPLLRNNTLATGKVGLDVTAAEASFHAMRAGLVLISAMRRMLGSLDHVAQIRRVFGLVNAVPEFEDHPIVINGCSDLLRDVFGDRGRHARTAVGMSSLPGNITVEIDAVVSILPNTRPSK